MFKPAKSSFFMHNIITYVLSLCEKKYFTICRLLRKEEIQTICRLLRKEEIQTLFLLEVVPCVS